jgi:hypothetical protein
VGRILIFQNLKKEGLNHSKCRSSPSCLEISRSEILFLDNILLQSLFSNFNNILRMLEHYERAAKALGLDLDKIYMALMASSAILNIIITIYFWK